MVCRRYNGFSATVDVVYIPTIRSSHLQVVRVVFSLALCNKLQYSPTFLLDVSILHKLFLCRVNNIVLEFKETEVAQTERSQVTLNILDE